MAKNFSENSANRIIDGIRRIEKLPVDVSAHRPQQTRFTNARKFRHGFLKGDLSAPSSPTGPPTSAVVREYKRDPSTNELTYLRDFTVYNFDTTLTAEEGTYLKSERIEGLDEIYWIACEPSLVVMETESSEELETESGEWIELDL